MPYSREPFIQIPGDDPQDMKVKAGHGNARASGDTDIFAEKSRAAWHSGEVAMPRCDFSAGKTALTAISGGIRAITLWRRSLYGMSLGEIKLSRDMPGFCARHLAALISAVLGQRLSPLHFVIVSPPKRRHPGKENFASRMCAAIAGILGLPYIDDFALCRSRQRIDATFTLGAPLPDQQNIIVIDDIITTGSTLAAMHRLIQANSRNDIYFAAILNRK